MKASRLVIVAVIAAAGFAGVGKPAMALSYVSLLDHYPPAVQVPPTRLYYLTYQCQKCSKIHNGGVYNDLDWAKWQTKRFQAQGYRVAMTERIIPAEPPKYEIRYDITYQDPRDGKVYYGGSGNAGGRDWAIARGKAIEQRGYRVAITARRVFK